MLINENVQESMDEIDDVKGSINDNLAFTKRNMRRGERL